MIIKKKFIQRVDIWYNLITVYIHDGNHKVYQKYFIFDRYSLLNDSYIFLSKKTNSKKSTKLYMQKIG